MCKKKGEMFAVLMNEWRIPTHTHKSERIVSWTEQIDKRNTRYTKLIDESQKQNSNNNKRVRSGAKRKKRTRTRTVSIRPTTTQYIGAHTKTGETVNKKIWVIFVGLQYYYYFLRTTSISTTENPNRFFRVTHSSVLCIFLYFSVRPLSLSISVSLAQFTLSFALSISAFTVVRCIYVPCWSAILFYGVFVGWMYVQFISQLFSLFIPFSRIMVHYSLDVCHGIDDLSGP